MGSTELHTDYFATTSNPVTQRSILWCRGKEFHSTRVPRRGAKPRFLLPVGAWNTPPLSHRGTDAESQAGVEGKKEWCREGNERDWKKKDDGKRWKGGRKEVRWLIDRVRVWEVGRDSQVQSQRTQVDLPARQRWTMASRIPIRFPVHMLICMKTKNRNDPPRYITGFK